MAVLIKRYANRKLYNTESSRYITLKGISELVRDGRDIRVIDNESGKDITPVVLSQILVDDQKHPDQEDGGVPGRVLSELIQKGGDAIYGLLRRSIDDAQGNLSEARDNVRRFLHTTPESLDPTELSRLIHQTVERVIRVMDLPTRADLETLNSNVERLATALERFERRVSQATATAKPRETEDPIRPHRDPEPRA